jgi:hypothetical protein
MVDSGQRVFGCIACCIVVCVLRVCVCVCGVMKLKNKHSAAAVASLLVYYILH